MASARRTAIKTQRGLERLAEQQDETSAALDRIEMRLDNIILALETLVEEKAPAARGRKKADVDAE